MSLGVVAKLPLLSAYRFTSTCLFYLRLADGYPPQRELHLFSVIFHNFVILEQCCQSLLTLK